MLGEGNLAFLLNESWGISSLSLPREAWEGLEKQGSGSVM